MTIPVEDHEVPHEELQLEAGDDLEIVDVEIFAPLIRVSGKLMPPRQAWKRVAASPWLLR